MTDTIKALKDNLAVVEQERNQAEFRLMLEKQTTRTFANDILTFINECNRVEDQLKTTKNDLVIMTAMADANGSLAMEMRDKVDALKNAAREVLAAIVAVETPDAQECVDRLKALVNE